MTERRKEITVGWKAGKRHTIEVMLWQTEKGPELSICASIWQRDGRDIEQGGQCIDTVVGELAGLGTAVVTGVKGTGRWQHAEYSDGIAAHITQEWLTQALTYWVRWHLNGMRAGCEHQRASWNVIEQIVMVTYKLKSELIACQNSVERAALGVLRSLGSATLTDEERKLLALPYEVKAGADQPAPGPQYEERSRETKGAGWVYPKEHPKGLLCKPCPVCGYKYGSAWLHEPLPPEVVKWAEAALR